MRAETSPAALALRDLAIDRGGRTIVPGLSLDVPAGSIIGLLGPNGCGKSTVLRAVYRALQPRAGAVLLDGEDLLAMPARGAAQQVAALAQQADSDLDFTVGEVVALGRVPHSGGGRLSTRERALCDRALADLGITHLRDRGILGLSGGERQRVLLARALVQEPRLLILDEPTNHLDLAHQLQLLRLLRALEVSVLVVLHDLNLASAVCDRLHLMRDGRIVAGGTPAEVITPEILAHALDVRAVVIDHPVSKVPQVLLDPGTSPEHHPGTEHHHSDHPVEDTHDR